MPNTPGARCLNYLTDVNQGTAGTSQGLTGATLVEIPPSNIFTQIKPLGGGRSHGDAIGVREGLNASSLDFQNALF